MNGPLLLLVYFAALFILLLKGRTVALVFLATQIVSLAGTFLIGGNYSLDSMAEVVAFVATAVLLSMAILPWATGYRVKQIIPGDQRKIERVAKVLIALSVVPFFTLLITAVLITTRVEDINEFKYNEDFNTEFLYNLPVNIRLIILSNYLQNLSYLLVPLHFYFLSIRRYWLAGLCFAFSLNVVLFGMTFFSRWSLTHYVLLYLAFYSMMRDSLNQGSRSLILKTGAVLLILVIAYFVSITNRRFEYDSAYHELVPIDSKIRHPTAYSYISYLSQWYEQGAYKLTGYDYRTFSGQITFSPVLGLLGQYRIINYDSYAYLQLKKELWPVNADKFNGLSCYVIYDFGYLGSAIAAMVYFYFVRRLRPVEGRITVSHLFHCVLLMQIPLFAIFYSFLAGILIPYLMLIPILIYLKMGASAPSGRRRLAFRFRAPQERVESVVGR